MKYIIAVVKPHRLEQVREALSSAGIDGMTISEVKGYGRQKGHTEIYRGAEYQINFLPKIKVEIAVPDDLAATAIEAISTAAHTDQIGDGKIFTLPLEAVQRIRTGETGQEAL